MDYLFHHGILGQKWGDQNGPPYPLSKSDYSAAERKYLRDSKRFSKLDEKAHKLAAKADKKIEKNRKKQSKFALTSIDVELKKRSQLSTEYSKAKAYKSAQKVIDQFNKMQGKYPADQITDEMISEANYWTEQMIKYM